jgi:WD40 repeat protein
VCALAFDAKGTVLASAQEGKHAIIRVWDFASGTCLAVLMAHASGLTSVDVSADGKALLGVGLDQHGEQDSQNSDPYRAFSGGKRWGSALEARLFWHNRKMPFYQTGCFDDRRLIIPTRTQI